MSVYLHAKFQVSSITLTSFRHEGGGIGEEGVGQFYPPTSKQTPKRPTQMRVKMVLN